MLGDSLESPIKLHHLLQQIPVGKGRATGLETLRCVNTLQKHGLHFYREWEVLERVPPQNHQIFDRSNYLSKTGHIRVFGKQLLRGE